MKQSKSNAYHGPDHRHDIHMSCRVSPPWNRTTPSFPNFQRPFERFDTRSTTILMADSPRYSAPAIVCIITIITNVTFVALRTWGRFLQKSHLMFADILVPISLAMNIGQAALIIYLWNTYERYGEKGPLAARGFAFPLLNAFATAIPKLAVISVYLQIFHQKTWAKWVLRGTAAIVVAAALALIFATIFQCRPTKFIWDHSIPGGVCSDLHSLFSYLFIPNVVTDVILLLVPIPIITRLQMSLPVKAGVLATFLSGSIGVVAASIRLHVFFQFTPRKGDAGTQRIASNVEISSYLTVACLLHMRPLLARIKTPLKYITESWGTRNYGNTSSKSPSHALATLTDRRANRRLPSESTNSSEGQLVLSDQDGIHVLHDMKVDEMKASTATMPQNGPATTISSKYDSYKDQSIV
ncbi:hypothetical protein BDV95DRAFT_310249 [Massariosphaeria phaeospora]|uniref:Rhodopsin domain-containing protein n=1 Tax=Massariosphaeria phaeospora TaxID=100035 RepID=A0A7C8IB26_9PLEO|nr:hypothetical protein BDV95DRAFT_310249 [Massariosphaeria phaeospora]